MAIQSIINHLSTSLPELNDSINTPINCGGCGIFAKLLSDKLDELNIPHTIESIFIYGNPYEATLKECINGNEEDIYSAVPSHILIKINGEYIDSEGIVNHKVKDCEPVETPYDLLNKLIDKGCWNPTFNRKAVPLISEKLDSIFNNLNN